MFDKKIFKSQLSEFLNDSIIICNENSNNLIIDDIKWPEFFSNGKYKKFNLEKIPDYDYFINRTLKNKIILLPTYSILTKFFVTKEFLNYNNKLLNVGKEHISKKNNYSKELPLKFLIEYLKNNNEFTINLKIFKKTFDHFFNFLENLLSDEYVAPIFNFESDINLNGIKINDIGIRKINDLEFYIFSKLDENNHLSNNFHNLTHVIFTKFASDNLNNGHDIAKQKFQTLIESLSLYAEGNPQFGTIYRNINNPWIHYDSKFEIDVIPSSKLEFKKIHKNKIIHLYNLLNSVDLTIKGNKFLDISKKRFISALSRTDQIDQLVDLMIGLESLYVSSPGEITVRLSNRLSTLLSKNDIQREELWVFTKKVYNMRSGIVHGEGIRNTMINGGKYSLDEIIKKLIELNRLSLIIFLNLVNHYSENNKIDRISEDIDKSLINRTFLKKFKKKLN
jgi:hypothetical protein